MQAIYFLIQLQIYLITKFMFYQLFFLYSVHLYIYSLAYLFLTAHLGTNVLWHTIKKTKY